MSSAQSTEKTARLHVENIGGISETTVELEPGVTALSGRNATNRTSLLQAIMAALGSDRASLKGDAKEGSVTLTIGDRTYSRTLKRRGDTVVTEGDPYLEDSTLADLFAFLLETNEARQAVARGDDLRELIMRPIDTDAIQAEVEQLETEKRQLDRKIDDLDSLDGRLPELEQRRTELKSQIQEKRDELEEKEREIEEADANIEQSREDRAELEDKLDELKSARSDLEDVRYDLDAEAESIEALEDEQEELREERAEIPDELDDGTAIQSEISDLRDRMQTLDSTVNELQTVIQFNEDMLEGTSADVAEALRDGQEHDHGSVTDALVESDTVVCWTCGTNVETSQIEATIDRLRDLRREKLDRRNDVRSRIDELEDERAELDSMRRRREKLDDRIASIEDELDRRQNRREELKSRRTELSESIEDLESEVEELEERDYGDVLELHREANQLEFEIGRLESEVEDVESEMEEVESRLDERDDLEERREEISEQLGELRTRIERIEREAIEQFNTHMETVLDILDYANLDRIWIERTEKTVREGRRKVDKSVFDMHIIRSSESGASYEDTIDHLSESEREVTGLVFALAGYLVHDVHETVPFMLLDSLEAIDSERIAQLIDYISDHADYTVAALLPEDAAAVSDQYERVTEI
ncbi:archaea-specific SMC-related protein [Halopelagius longus]|uniref:AAA domain-containing protein n=1 Tax=Halopelagius longus TaxID=1236180 RepID=A0A1H1GGF5_9EURY|nr:archaea-specific SMC-related protein [Halopelagius longus]RDI69613.1 chromosome segregation protein SMC [Halopelagius longus]SDR12169.1 AAA domain-containing protein [Halopelagius longus]